MAKQRTPMSATVEALIYTRVSSDLQAETGVSLDMQLAECRRWAASQGYVLGREYQDVMSGSRDDRPAYAAMLDEIRTMAATGKRIVVVTWRLDRMGRKVLERVQRRAELKALGCEIASATEGGIVSDLTANILASVAEEETRVLSERCKGARRRIVANGWRPIGDVPWGYLVRDATPEERAAGAPSRVLDIEPMAAATVRECFERAAGGESIRSVARWLSGLPSEARGDRAWGPQATSMMLARCVYAARNEAEGGDPLDAPRGHWPAIVSDEVWAAVQRERVLSRRLPKQATGGYLLSGFARCRVDGTKMVGGRGGNGRCLRYRCDKNGCAVSVKAGSLDEAVLRQVTPLLDLARIDGQLRRELRAEWDRLRGAGVERVDARRIERLRAEVERGQKRLASAAIMLLDGTIDRAGYDLARAQIEADVTAAGRELERLEAVAPSTPALPDLDEALGRVGDWGRALASTDVPGRRRVLAELIERVDPVRVGYGKYDADITWTKEGEALRLMAARLERAA